MNTAIRSVLYLALAVWLGSEIFFPITAAITFGSLSDTHSAGTIVGQVLRVLHKMGLVSGSVALAALALAVARGLYRPAVALWPVIAIVLMLALTAYSQFGIIPAMERDRVAAGGAIQSASPDDPGRTDFERLHKRSVKVEGAVLLLGIAAVVLVAYAESARK